MLVVKMAGLAEYTSMVFVMLRRPQFMDAITDIAGIPNFTFGMSKVLFLIAKTTTMGLNIKQPNVLTDSRVCLLI